MLNRLLETSSVREAKSELAHYFARHAANSCLDTLSLVLLVSLGNLSESREIKNFAQFSSILLVSNFFIFITIYPALLSLVLQVRVQLNLQIRSTQPIKLLIVIVVFV